ncbi:MAG: hypothetical protein AAGE96_13840 [Cyanobacteria bacterium P01_G01_bin.19]
MASSIGEKLIEERRKRASTVALQVVLNSECLGLGLSTDISLARPAELGNLHQRESE